MTIGDMIITIALGLCTSAFYGIFLSHKEESAREFLRNFPSKCIDYKAEVLIRAPVPMVWEELVRFEKWNMWMFGSAAYKAVEQPLVVGSEIREVNGSVEKVIAVEKPFFLKTERHMFFLSQQENGGEFNETHFTYVYSDCIPNLPLKVLLMLWDGLLRVFSRSGKANLIEARANAFCERIAREKGTL